MSDTDKYRNRIQLNCIKAVKTKLPDTNNIQSPFHFGAFTPLVLQPRLRSNQHHNASLPTTRFGNFARYDNISKVATLSRNSPPLAERLERDDGSRRVAHSGQRGHPSVGRELEAVRVGHLKCIIQSIYIRSIFLKKLYESYQLGHALVVATGLRIDNSRLKNRTR